MRYEIYRKENNEVTWIADAPDMEGVLKRYQRILHTFDDVAEVCTAFTPEYKAPVGEIRDNRLYMTHFGLCWDEPEVSMFYAVRVE